jgi:uncharacterized membrane protein (DUF485 family)
MSDGTASDARPAAPGAQEGRTALVDWTRIERSAEFRELTARRHRFIAACAVVTFGVFLLYLGLATFATGFMGTTVGGVPIAWLAAMTQVLLTWAVTWAYLRRADRVFAPLEQRVADTAGPRFTREHDVEPDTEPSAPAPTEGSAR